MDAWFGIGSCGAWRLALGAGRGRAVPPARERREEAAEVRIAVGKRLGARIPRAGPDAAAACGGGFPRRAVRIRRTLSIKPVKRAADYKLSRTGSSACSLGWFVSLLVRKEVLLAGLCERKILF